MWERDVREHVRGLAHGMCEVEAAVAAAAEAAAMSQPLGTQRLMGLLPLAAAAIA